MKLLFISCLPETMSGGPKYSVPRQVENQARYDDVNWINMSSVDNVICNFQPKNILDVEVVISLIEESKPELVIFEDFYYVEFCKIAKKLVKMSIPYVIVPRGSMTKKAQRKKYFKKMFGNILFFNSFARDAIAIEFLTNDEKNNTKKKWKSKGIIIPNGTDLHDIKLDYEKSINKSRIIGSFIGRIDLYHKGIDRFLEAVYMIKDELLISNCRIDFYGPCDKKNSQIISKLIKKYCLESVISINGEVHGEEKRNVLLNSDFFVLTSRFEGMPMGLLEALSYGLPSIVTYGTNMGKEIIEYNAGFCSNCDTLEIKDNLLKIIQLDETKKIEMEKNAVMLSKNYNWDTIASKTHIEYDRIIRGLYK